MHTAFWSLPSPNSPDARTIPRCGSGTPFPFPVDYALREDEHTIRIQFRAKVEVSIVVKTRDGVLESEQIRRAINDWLEKKGVKKTGRKRAVTRKRP